MAPPLDRRSKLDSIASRPRGCGNSPIVFYRKPSTRCFQNRRFLVLVQSWLWRNRALKIDLKGVPPLASYGTTYNVVYPTRTAIVSYRTSCSLSNTHSSSVVPNIVWHRYDYSIRAKGVLSPATFSPTADSSQASSFVGLLYIATFNPNSRAEVFPKLFVDYGMRACCLSPMPLPLMMIISFLSVFSFRLSVSLSVSLFSPPDLRLRLA